MCVGYKITIKSNLHINSVLLLIIKDNMFRSKGKCEPTKIMKLLSEQMWKSWPLHHEVGRSEKL